MSRSRLNQNWINFVDLIEFIVDIVDIDLAVN